MNTRVFSPDAQRGDLTRLLKNLAIDPNQTLVQPYIIRLEKSLDASRSNYTFPFLSNPGSDRPMEIKLNRNDAFALSRMRLGICKQDETTTPKQYANFPTFYNADPNYFSGAPAGQVKEYVSLEPLYNSTISFKSQKTVRLSDLSTSIMKHVPERGYVTTASSSQPNPEFPQQSIGVEEYFRIMPNPVFSGQENNTAELVIGESILESIEGTHDAAGAAVTTRNVVVLELYGFLLVDAARPALQWNHF